VRAEAPFFAVDVLARADPELERLRTFFVAVAGRFVALTSRELVRCLGFADLTCVALRARAFPAGERLVAGFSLVAFALAVDLTEPFADEREEVFLTFLANGVLMRKLPRYSDSSLINPRKTSGKA
jgi:hypothetical protein